MKEFETSKLDCYAPYIKNKKDLELIPLELGKEIKRNNFALIFFKEKASVIEKTNKIDYYIFVNKFQFRKFCEKINNMDFFYLKEIKGKPVYFLTDLLGIDEFETRSILNNKKNIHFILNKLKKYLNYDLNYHKTIFSKSINDAQKENKRKYKFKNEIDSFFGFVNNNAYKDVFVFKEMRDKRKIFVLDVNSMYPFLLTLQRYPKPYSIKKVKIDSLKELDKFPFFLIRASVKIKKDLPEEDKNFIKEFHGIEYRINNYTIPIELGEDFEITTYFLKEEYDFYKKFLDFTLKDEYIIASEDLTDFSSLKELAEETFAKRLETKKLKKEDKRYEVIDNIIKNYLVALPSAFSQNSTSPFEKYFESKEKFKEFIKEKLGFIVRDFNIVSKPFSILGINKIKIDNKTLYKIRYKAFSYRFKDNLIHHHSVMFANARVLMMKYFYFFYQKRKEFNIEILYSNIDSIHISVNEKKSKEFLELLKKENLISEELGKLKLEAVADKGIWFDIGTYYLFDKNYQIVKYANPLPKSRKKPFQIVCAIKDYDEFGNEFFRKYELFKSFRYIKNFKNPPYEDFVKFKRISPNEIDISSFDEISERIKYNLLNIMSVYRSQFFILKEKNRENKEKF